MKYIDVIWKHEFDDEPVRLVSELDALRFETRKLEFFRDGQVGYAALDRSAKGTELSETTIPLLEEINLDPQFHGAEIKKPEFELLWDKYSDNI